MIVTPLSASANVDDEADVVDDIALGFGPSCPGCLGTTEPWQAARAVAWRCPHCDLTLIG